MITSIVLMVLAFIWLMRETDFLRVRLTGYDTTLDYINRLDNEVKEIISDFSQPDVLEPVKKSDSGYTPTEFIPLDMPEADGIINITSFRITESEYERVTK